MLQTEKRTHIWKRITCVLCVMALLLTSAPLCLPAFAAGQTQAAVTERFIYDDAVMYLNKDITDNGNGYFTLTIDAAAYLKKTNEPSSISKSADGIFEIKHDGYYLLELWGGNGGNGSASMESTGGDGGDGGHVYGYIHLQKGQTLVYTVGTNGRQIKGLNIGGGGENEGGDKEGLASYATGGGGGYSAVYLFDGAHGSGISESERQNNYIMIAGGGGGGGAGNQLAFGNKRLPHGGDGGSLTSNRQGNLTAGNNNGVAGTWFGGEDGFSSGTSTARIGQGGTNYVGVVNETDLGNTYNGATPNDWIGTYTYQKTVLNENIYVAPGSGGAGFLRGGAGGAGFCGGSGGLQDGVLYAVNIGGGGGGSSFISDKMTWQEIPSEYQQYIEGNLDNTVGGKINITYLGNVEIDKTKYDTVDMEFQISQYFDVITAAATNADGRTNGRLTLTATGTQTAAKSTGTKVSIVAADISPDDAGLYDNHLFVTILLRAKTDFAGGNNVPVFDAQPSLHAEKAGSEVSTMQASAATDYVNVPLNFKVLANSYASSDNSKRYPVSSLYTDSYAEVRNNLSGYWQYDFISAISAYTVEGYSVTGTVSPQVTTSYNVGFTVTPKTEKVANIGAAATTKTYTAIAQITILGADSFSAYSNAMEKNVVIETGKSLSYSADRGFDFGITSLISFDQTNFPTFHAGTDGMVYEVPLDGWYYVEALGGGGGATGTASVTGENGNDTRTAESSAGGVGGYTGGYIHLKAGDQLLFTLGTVGARSPDVHKRLEASTAFSPLSKRSAIMCTEGGGAGSPTTVTLNGTPVMLAGGGGGGGGVVQVAVQSGVIYSFATNKANGVPKAGTVSYGVTGTWGSLTAATAGQKGSGAIEGNGVPNTKQSVTHGKKGVAGQNYISSAFFGVDGLGNAAPSSVQANFKNYQKITPTLTAGQAAVTMIMPDTVAYASEGLVQGYVVDTAISRYFTVKGIDMVSDSAATVTQSQASDGTVTKVYKLSGTNTEIGRFSYKLIPSTDRSGIPYTKCEILNVATTVTVSSGKVSAKPSFRINAVPADGFLGGYDVPFLLYNAMEPGSVVNSISESGVIVRYGSGKMNLSPRNAADFANVPLSYSFAEENFQVTPEKTITCGEQVNLAALLVANTIPLPTGSEAWKAEFVQAVVPTASTVRPVGNTSYSFTQTVKPKATEAAKAVTVNTVDPVTFTKSTSIYVMYTVTSQLENLDYEGPEKVLDGEGLDAAIKTTPGYELPEAVTVTVGGSVLSDAYYSYDSESGSLSISQSYITGNVVISAVGVPTEHKLYYFYVDPVDGREYEYVEEYISGESIDLTWYNNFNANVPPKEGNSFIWDWATDGNVPLTEMPGYDYYVYGMYVKNKYTLTVNYYLEGTAQTVAPTHTEKVYYQNDYSVLSPAVAGYTTDRITVTGNMPAGDVTVNVYYRPSANQLNIYYIYADTNEEAAPQYHASIQTGSGYTVASPAVTGYTPRIPTVSGNMVAQGVNVYVYYDPNRYTVTFDAGEGKITADSSTATKAVEYHNIYGYDPTAPEENRYGALPKAYLDGSDFLGWFTAPTGGVQITEESVVDITADQRLYAHYTTHEYVITIQYQYTDSDYEIRQYKHSAGDTYNYAHLPYEGYSTFVNGVASTAVSGTMGYSNLVIVVDYTIDSHTVTLMVYMPDDSGGYALDDSYETAGTYGTEYSFVLSNLEADGYTLKESAIQLTNHIPAEKLDSDPVYAVPENGADGAITGRIGISDTVIHVFYDYIQYTLTVHYTYENGTKAFDDHITTFHVGEYVAPILSPALEGHTPSQEQVAGEKLPAGNLEGTITYSINQYTLKIRYIYSELMDDETLAGTVAAESYIQVLDWNTPYSIPSPELEGYSTDMTVVSGTLKTDTEITVCYFPEDIDVISVTVELNDIRFDYASAAWDPETHLYKTPDGTITPKNSNAISVTNEIESQPVTVSVTYLGIESTDYHLSHRFTTENASDADALDIQNRVIAEGENITAYLWLSGDINVSKALQSGGNLIVGTVIVVIGKVGDAE